MMAKNGIQVSKPLKSLGKRGKAFREQEKGKLSLPVSFKSLKKISETIDSVSEESLDLLVLVDETIDHTLLAYLQQVLQPRKSSVTVSVRRYGEELLAIPMLDNLCAVIILAAQSVFTGRVVRTVRTYTDAVVTLSTHPELLLSQFDSENILREIEDVIPVPLAENFPLPPLDSGIEPPLILALLEELASWFSGNLIDDDHIIIARAYPFVRRAIARELTRKAAFKNAMIATVFFLPGADMPLMTLNQVRLVMQIAALYEFPLGMARVKEITLLVAGAFGCRALARAVVRRLPFPGFLVRIGVSYAATMGVGIAAQKFYDSYQGDFAVLGESLINEGKLLVASTGDTIEESDDVCV